MTHLWNQRFDALERVLEAEKKHIENNDMETPIVSAALAGMEEGWNQSLDRPAEHL